MPSVLVTGLKAHASSREARSEGVPEGAVPNAHDADRIRKRICVTWLTGGGPVCPAFGRVQRIKPVLPWLDGEDRHGHDCPSLLL